jgi:phosphoribosylformylglycinamidine synthase subunit PurQ / glutaminase
MQPTALLIRTAGTNCDAELAHAFRLAGAKVEVVHVNRLIDQPRLLDRAHIIGVPGGFSYGDDIAAGRIFANRLRQRLLGPLADAVERGVAMIGICNGFQVLVKMGLLPALDRESIGRQVATLADNTSGRFIDRWVRLAVPPDTACIWTRGLTELELPIAHAEGRFTVADQHILDRLRRQHQVALRYAADDNPNGSVADIAGICDPTGLVFGLMPHPERYVHPTHHPPWTRQVDPAWQQTPAGLRIIANAVEHAASMAAAAARA